MLEDPHLIILPKKHTVNLNLLKFTRDLHENKLCNVLCVFPCRVLMVRLEPRESLEIMEPRETLESPELLDPPEPPDLRLVNPTVIHHSITYTHNYTGHNITVPL